MDWKYKHFYQERVFSAPRDLVMEAARTFMSESLGWQITDTPDGFRAEGYSFAHRSIAHLRIQSAGFGPAAPAGGSDNSAGGTKVAVELLVERASPGGFMLFDVGGYYSIQIRKWLDGIQCEQ